MMATTYSDILIYKFTQTVLYYRSPQPDKIEIQF